MLVILLSIIGSIVSLVAVPAQGDAVTVSSSVEESRIVQQFSGSEVLPIELYLTGDGDAALFGCELAVEAASSDLVVRSVTFDPVFSASVGDRSAVQPLAAVNRSLGADGAPVHFATVEVEVLTGGPFESALIVKARGALVGKLPEFTTVLGVTAPGNEFAEGRIEIVNLGIEGSGDQGTEGEEAIPWTVEQASAAVEIRLAGGGAPVTVLAPDTEYELHYTAGGNVNGFDLYVTTAAADGPPLGVGGSEMPAFEACWPGAEVTDLPPADDAPDAQRQVVSADTLTRNSTPETGNSLCSFTTGAAGALTFNLRLYHTDPESRTVVEMPAAAEFTVE